MHHPSPYIWNVAFCFSGGVFFGRRQFSTLVAKFLATMESGIFFVHQVDLGIVLFHSITSMYKSTYIF